MALIKKYITKESCIKYIENKQHLKLFSENINANMDKNFMAISYEEAYKLSLRNNTFLYEHFEDNTPIKLFFNIEYKIKKDTDTNIINDIFKNILKKTIEMVTDQLQYKYKIFDQQIIILAANTYDKLEARVIFKNVHFKNIQELLYFFATFRGNTLIENKIIDLHTYKTKIGRLLWNSEYNHTNKLIYNSSINYTQKTQKNLFMDCLIMNVLHDSIFVPVKISIDIENKLTLAQNLTINNNVNTEIIQSYIDLLDSKRVDDYTTWSNIGMAIKNSNNTNEAFEVWHTWSAGSEKYCTREACIKKWNTFKDTNKTIRTLIYYAKQDNPDKIKDVECVLEQCKFDVTYFDQPYLLEKNSVIKNNSNIVTENIVKWAEDTTIKTIAIKSPYNTGKTSMLKQLLTEYSFKKILFISYRQTLTYELYGGFKSFGFKNYMDGDYNAKRLICQIESLYKLIFFDLYGDNTYVNTYDLVIIDEIESVLDHFTSSTIKNKENIFNIMAKIIQESPKLLVLDGDFHNRAYDFINSFGNSIILHNTHKKDKRNFIFTNDSIGFTKKIDDDLKNGNKIVLVSMALAIATEYYEQYEKSYKCVFHNSRSDDSLKYNITDVENYWDKFDMVIYTPSIESGVSFDKDYFDKIYLIVSTNSTTQRGALQMCSRVRKVKDTTINVYLNNVPFIEKAGFYTFDEAKEYVMVMQNMSISYTNKTQNEKNMFKNKYNPFVENLVHNQKEILNGSKFLFIPYFIKLIEQKGHTCEKDYTKKTNFKNDYSAIIQQIINTEDINYEEYAALLINIKNNQATHIDKLKIERFNMKILWKQDELTQEFIKKYYGQKYIIQNLRLLHDSTMLNNNGNDIMDHDNTNKMEQVSMIKGVIKGLGFKHYNSNVKLSSEQFIDGIEDVILESRLFKDINNSYIIFKNEALFKIQKLKLKTDKKRLFLSIINNIFKDWGIHISIIKKKAKVDKKVVSKYYYTITVINEIDKYI
jgi:hypothetical protein